MTDHSERLWDIRVYHQTAYVVYRFLLPTGNTDEIRVQWHNCENVLDVFYQIKQGNR